jgi:hypothetical protein
MYQYILVCTTHLDSCHQRCRTYIRCRTCMTYNVVRATYHIVLYIVRAMSYVWYTGYRRTTSYVRHHTSSTMSYVNLRHRMSHIRHCMLSSPHIVYNVVCLKWTYVHDIRYCRFISYTTSYSRTMSHVNIRYLLSDVRCRKSFRGGRFRCFKGTIIPFIIRIPCTILVIAVLRRQGWNRASKANDVLWCYLNNFCSCIYRIRCRIQHLRPTYDIVCQNTCSCQSYVRYRIRCRIRHRTFLYDIVRATYDIAGKRTTSYVFYRFLPVVRATFHTTSYFFWRCSIRCAMQHQYYTILYVRFRCRWFTSPKTYDIALRRRMQYRSIGYAIRSIRYACLGRRQARRDVLAMPLQLPLVLLPDPWLGQMVYIAPAPCRSSFPQSGTLRCGQCEWWVPCVQAKIGTAPDQNSSWLVCM